MRNNLFGPDSIEQLLDRPIAYQRAFVRLGAGITGAVFLSQAVYWSKRTDDDGWFWKTQEEWEEETGLSRTEQEGARRKLKKLGILVEKKQGIPCKLWFRIDFNELCNALAEIHAAQTSMRKTSRQARGKQADRRAGNKQSSTETTTEITEERDAPPEMSEPEPSDQAPASRSHSPEKESRIVAPTETENSVESTVIDDHQAEAGYTEEEHPAARTGKRKASAKGTRLPDDWKLPKPWGDWAMEQGLSRQDVLMEADTFRDYWISTTKNPTKRAWEATWRNWIRRAKQGTRHAERRHHSETPLQASLRESEEILQRARAGTLGTEWDFSLDGDEMFGVVQPPKRALPAQGSDGVPGEAARRLTHT